MNVDPTQDSSQKVVQSLTSVTKRKRRGEEKKLLPSFITISARLSVSALLSYNRDAHWRSR